MNLDQWNKSISLLQGAHLLQTKEWSQIKQELGWLSIPRFWSNDLGEINGAALVLARSIRVGRFPPFLKVLYIPRGPVGDWNNPAWRGKVLDDIQSLARQQRAIFIKMDPEVILGTGIPGESNAKDDPDGAGVVQELKSRGWRFSDDQIQFRNTVWIDLQPSEDEMLKRMKQKTRYNIRLAERKGVTIRTGTQADFSLLYRMYAETSQRDNFVIRPQAYYEKVWRTFMGKGMAEPLIAEVEGSPAAALIWFHFAGKAWYLYGMSRTEHREWMPNYLLQWEVMKRARAAGCNTYDLWGAPDIFNEEDSMWGVFRFKEGLGGNVIRTIGAWDYPTQPWIYSLYTSFLPRILNIMRRRGKEATKREAGL
jgi:peptidoglycan pentaglycine glycine transferase (the first glycine)